MMRAVPLTLTLALFSSFSASPCLADTNAVASSAATTDTSTAAVGACVADHENARLQRVREQWHEARAAMTRCSADGCPLAIRSDCRAWLDELTRLLPTVLIVVERDDDRKQPLGLELDGRPLSLPEPLGPIELLPGTHKLRATLPPYLPIEQEITLKKGEKNLVVQLRFARDVPRDAPREAPTAAPLPASAPARSSRPIPSLTYWFGGGALLAFGTSGVLFGSAMSSLSSARSSCSPVCKTSVRDSIDARLLAADVFGGVGIALAAVALTSYLSRPSVVESQTSLSPSLGFSSKGAEFSLTGRF